MKNLYELTSDYMRLQQMLEDGDYTEEQLADTFEMIEDDIEIKAEGYGLVMANMETISEGCDREIKRLSEYKKTVNNGIDSLKNNLKNSMLAIDKTKFKTDHFAFSFRKSESVAVEDINLLPTDYVKVKETKSVDKTAIKKALKSGESIEGATLQVNQNLQIK